MNENDAMRLLGEANPVRLEDVTQLDFPGLAGRRHPFRRLALAAAVVTATLAAVLIGVFAFGGQSSRPAIDRKSRGGGIEESLPGATVEHPLAGAERVPLADAVATFGSELVVPDTSLVGPSDLGPIWMYTNRDQSDIAVALTFPKQGMFIQYLRPRPEGSADLVAVYRDIARQNSNFHVLDLNGVTALAADQNSDDTGHNFGVVAFPGGGSEIRVFGHYDQTTLEAVAQSIVDRSGGPGVVLNPRASPPTMEYPLGKGFGQSVSLAEAASALGRPVTLPDTAQVKPSDAGAVWMESSTGDGQKLVDLGISFPKQGLIVQYIQPPSSDPLSNYQVAVSNSEGSLIYLNGGVPALTQHSPLPDGSPWGFVQFVAGGSTIVVMGHPDQATLQSVAQAILDRIGS